jgi:hypothetical protein
MAAAKAREAVAVAFIETQGSLAAWRTCQGSAAVLSCPAWAREIVALAAGLRLAFGGLAAGLERVGLWGSPR